MNENPPFVFFTAHNAIFPLTVLEVVRLGTIPGNRFGSKIGEVTIYCGRLNRILSRYYETHGQYVEHTRLMSERARLAGPGTRQLTVDDLPDMTKSADLTSLLHLDFESFYLFAEILLSKVSRAIEFYFGAARRASLNDHRDLVKNFASYAEQKGLNMPDALIDAAKRLNAIVYFRDKYVEHSNAAVLTEADFVMRTTIVDSSGRTRMGVQGNSGRGEHAEHLPDLIPPIDEYIGLAVALIQQNTEKCAIAPETGPSTLTMRLGG